MDMSPDSPISDGAESVQSDGPGSTVPTEPLNASERRLVDNYMSHRQQFMSDFERYNPVQNLSVLASHVFDVSHNIRQLNSEFDSSRRLMNIISENQRSENESLRGLGEDTTSLKDDVYELKKEVGELRGMFKEIQASQNEGIQELKNMLAMLMGGVRA